MPDPPWLDLVHKAISANNIEWKDAAYRRLRGGQKIQGYTPEGIRILLRDFVGQGNQLDAREEMREEWQWESPYWYRAIIPVSEFPRGLFVEVILLDDDEDEPFVQIVNAHPQF